MAFLFIVNMFSFFVSSKLAAYANAVLPDLFSLMLVLNHGSPYQIASELLYFIGVL